MIILISARPLALASYKKLVKSFHWAAGKKCLCDVSIEREGIGNAEDQKDHDGTSVSEQPQEWHVIE
jgi:hypothetical protein